MENLDTFLEFAESLKLVRKAEIEYNGSNVVNQIYTDLLPSNAIINKVNLPRTTILIGRKGTGKSTIFQKSQQDLDKNKKYLTLYIDVKSLYDNSTPVLPSELNEISDTHELTKYLVYSNFIKEIILKTKEKLKQRLQQKVIYKLIDLSDVVLDDIYVELDKIEFEIDNVFKSLNANFITSYKNTIDKKNLTTSSIGFSASNSEGIGVKLEASGAHNSEIKKEFDNSLVTYLDIKKCFINNLLKLKELLRIKNIFIFLDDFSEIDKTAQILFMDWFIAPVNNLSEDFVKFKIATYPKRFYYGKLDNVKIDEISLDFFDAFYTHEKKTDNIDITKMEALALDYSKRLIENRIKIYFPNDNWSSFFSFDPKFLYQILFEVSLNTPRKIGYILSYCYESCLIYNQKISKSSIEDAAQRFYVEIIEKYFLVNEHICKPFEDKITNEHQYELLNKIIERQIQNNSIIKRRKYKETSHFYINSQHAYLLDNLELNNFISTYNKIKDETNIATTVYSLDYGLCKNYGLTFRNTNTKKYGKNYTQPIYNFNNLVIDYFNSTQIIRCEKGHEFPYSDIAEFKRYKMICSTCLDDNIKSICKIEMKFKDLQKQFSESEMIEKIAITFHDFLILDLLKLSQKPISQTRISESLDISPTTIANNLKRLTDKNMCELDIEISKQLKSEYFRITGKGVRIVEKIFLMTDKLRKEKNIS